MKRKYDVQDLMRKFNEYRSYKQATVYEWRLIRSLYKGQFWQVFRTYLKDYSITPDWNYFEYVVQAYLNSVYSGAFIGTITPINEEDSAFISSLNAFVRYKWNQWGMKNKYLHIGENGELYNLGAIRVDWVDSIKDIKLSAISPDELYFDPSVDCYKNGECVFIERSVNINKLKLNKDYKDEVETYMTTHKTVNDKTQPNRLAGYENNQTTNNKTVSFIECLIRNEEGFIDQVFILDEAVIVFERLNTGLKNFNVVAYAPQRPDGNPYGNSKLNKILNTTVALNILDSLEATQPYRLLNRVRFVDVSGRINMRSFADYGNTPGASFEVKGDPSKIVHYVDVPVIPDLTNIKNRLENSIFQVTGVDPQYKGRITNSLQTTGATQAYQARVTMLTDNSRITMLEEFTEDVTRLILDYYFMYGKDNIYKVPKLSATGTNKVIGKHELNFAKHRGINYDFKINASTLLPSNQANLFESAKALYEMQGQYGFKQEVITAKDLVRFSDFPQKELFLQRLEKQEQENTGENLVADLTNFASIFSRMLSEGLSEEEAAQQAIQILIEEKNAMQQDPTIGQGFK